MDENDVIQSMKMTSSNQLWTLFLNDIKNKTNKKKKIEMGNDVIVSLLFQRKIGKAIGMTSSFIQTEISLHQFLLHKPTAEVGEVSAGIAEHATV